jgi:hypothetical protein
LVNLASRFRGHGRQSTRFLRRVCCPNILGR